MIKRRYEMANSRHYADDDEVEIPYDDALPYATKYYRNNKQFLDQFTSFDLTDKQLKEIAEFNYKYINISRRQVADLMKDYRVVADELKEEFTENDYIYRYLFVGRQEVRRDNYGFHWTTNPIGIRHMFEIDDKETILSEILREYIDEGNPYKLVLIKAKVPIKDIDIPYTLKQRAGGLKEWEITLKKDDNLEIIWEKDVTGLEVLTEKDI